MHKNNSQLWKNRQVNDVNDLEVGADEFYSKTLVELVEAKIKDGDEIANPWMSRNREGIQSKR